MFIEKEFFPPQAPICARFTAAETSVNKLISNASENVLSVRGQHSERSNSPKVERTVDKARIMDDTKIHARRSPADNELRRALVIKSASWGRWERSPGRRHTEYLGYW